MARMECGARVQAVRSFNRFYTKQIGVVQDKFLGSRFSLAEARVLQEIAQHDQATATEVSKALGLDAGYVSRKRRIGRGSTEHRSARPCAVYGERRVHRDASLQSYRGGGAERT